MTDLSAAQVAGVAIAAGFSGAAAVTAVAVSRAEDTNGDPNATNHNPDGSIDRGLWQINNVAHPEVADAQAFDPQGAAEAAYTISSGGTDWTPWATFNSGAYRDHLAEAQAAVGSPSAPAYTPGTLDLSTTTIAVSTPARPITDGVDLYSAVNVAKYTGPNYDLKAVTLNSGKLSAEFRNKVTAATLTHTIDGADTVSITFSDSDRAVLTSAALQAKSLLKVRGRWYQLVQVSTSGSSTTCTFEDLVTSRLRGQWGLISVPAGQTTRPAFIQRLCAEAHVHSRIEPDERVDPLPGDPSSTSTDATGTEAMDIALVLTGGLTAAGATSRWSTVLSKSALTRGSSTTPNETSMDAITRMAGQVGWRAFSDGLTLWSGSDSWLMAQHGAVSMSENKNGVGWFSGDYDLAKVTGNDATFTTTVDFTTPVGTMVKVPGMGLLGGTWMVRTVVRNAFSAQVQVTLTRAQGDLAEPADTETVAAGAAGLPGNGSAVAAGSVAATVIAAAESKLGAPYVWGAAGPDTFDCSGLAQWCYKQAGISIPRTTYAQWTALPPVALGQEQPGDLVYFDPDDTQGGLPGHVGIYVGDGQMIDAPNSNTVVREESVSGFGSYMGGQPGATSGARRPK